MTMPVIVVLLGPLSDPGFVSDQDTHGLAVPDACPDRWPRAARPIPRVVDHDHHHASSALRGLLFVWCFWLLFAVLICLPIDLSFATLVSLPSAQVSYCGA